jgi:hypothetical protein
VEVISMPKIKTKSLSAEWFSDKFDSEDIEAREAFLTWLWSDRSDRLDSSVQKAWLEAMRCHEYERLH